MGLRIRPVYFFSHLFQLNHQLDVLLLSSTSGCCSTYPTMTRPYGINGHTTFYGNRTPFKYKCT